MSRTISYMTLAILHIALVGTSTCFVLPAQKINPRSVKKDLKKEISRSQHETEGFLNDTTKNEIGKHSHWQQIFYCKVEELQMFPPCALYVHTLIIILISA